MAIITETFESIPLSLPFTGDWVRVETSPHSGLYCYRNRDIGDGETSATELQVVILEGGGSVSFWLRTDTEGGYDEFSFYVDGVPIVDGPSGSTPWSEVSGVPLTAGPHTLRWEYVKDGSSSEGDDSVYIDDVTITNMQEMFVESVSCDTMRRVMAAETITADTMRRIAQTETVHCDTKRRIATTLSGYSSLSIALAAKTISDRYSVTKPSVMTVGDNIAGQIKDFPFTVNVTDTSDNGKTWTANCSYDIEDKLNKPLAISSHINVAAGLAIVIAALGKTPSIDIDTFITQSMSDTNPTYRDIISYWVGWTDVVPNHQINVFERGSTIYAMQRGKETSVYTVLKSTLTNRTRKKLRTLQDSVNTEGYHTGGELAGDINQTPVYKNGTVSFGDTSITYANGLVTSENHTNSDGVTEYTTYSYSASSPPARLVNKTTIAGEKEIETDYTYSSLDGEYYLSKEVETEYDAEGAVVTQRVTRHIDLGQDNWGTILEVDGETVSTSLGQGAPSGDATAYTLRRNSTTSRPTAALSGRPTNGNEIPVTDQASLNRIAGWLEWLNGKIEERVYLDVYDDHIVDFTERVAWQGNEYYLESNNISHNVPRFVQSIELVRWY